MSNSRPLRIVGHNTAGPIYETPKDGEGVFVASDGSLHVTSMTDAANPTVGYTKGPWEIGLGRQIVTTERVKATVAQIITTNGDYETSEANARLIAAAPELLEALQGLEPYLDAIVCYASTMGEHEPNRLVVKARAAITKATGGTQ